MMVKMIQNIENKMELQINSLETWIEKMQERFNKDLEEIKNTNIAKENEILRYAAAAAKSLQSCLTLCDPTDSSTLGSPVPGIL